MKKIICFLLFSSFFCGLALAAPTFKKGATVYVNVKSCTVRAGTGLFAKKLGTFTYGTQLVVVESNSKSTQVMNPAKKTTGWIATGSITLKKITGSSGSALTASQSELALAGKGFSAEAEKAFKASNGLLNYADIDEVEKIKVDEEELKAFIKEGKLAGGNQ